MKTVRVRIDPADPETLKLAKVDLAQVDATTEEEIQAQMEEDEKEAMIDAARFARRGHTKLGLSLSEVSHRIDVSVETIRN